MTINKELGKKGENIAADYLLKNGYIILKRNWRYLKAEIDIIAQKNNILRIVEVKTRSTTYFGNPQDFVKPKKIKLLEMAANEYVISNNLEVEVCFDIIAVVIKKDKHKIEHFKSGFLYF